MASHSADGALDLSHLKVACKRCTLHQLCLPIGIDPADLEQLDGIITRRRPMKRGEHLFQHGDAFRAIYAVRSGSFKTYSLTGEGGEQITGFHLPGELIGLDAITSQRHPCAARALESASYCEIPFDRLEDLSGRLPSLRQQLLRMMSRELLNDQELLMLLGKKSADARLATFLLSLSARFKERGFSPSQFRLSMSRNDIGNYLGLAVETVSRLFTRLQEQGVVAVEGKAVELRDLDALMELARGTTGTV